MKVPVWLAAVLAGLAVLAGAFGAHGLQASGDARAVALVDTASRYQMWHALAVLAVAALAPRAAIAAWCFIGGIVLFCGSLYALALGAPRGVAMLAPLGGTAFVLGWALLAWALWRREKGNDAPRRLSD